MTRFMLEVPRNEELDVWPDDRIWAELQDRLAAAGRPPIGRGEIVERDVLDHRVRVCDPMQDSAWKPARPSPSVLIGRPALSKLQTRQPLTSFTQTPPSSTTQFPMSTSICALIVSRSIR